MMSCTCKPSHVRENSDNIYYDLGKMSTGERQKQCLVATTFAKKSNVVGFQQLRKHNGATTGKDETEILVRIFYRGAACVSIFSNKRWVAISTIVQPTHPSTII